MKNLFLRMAAAGAILLLAQSLAGAQSLGEIARKLRAERAAQGTKPVKVYTNDNIPHVPTIAPTGGETSGSQASAPSSANPAINVAQKAAETSSAEAKSSESSKDKMKTKDYWQAKFQAARAALAQAQEAQKLDEDELSLLQLQRARELDPNKGADLDNQIAAKQSSLDQRKAETAKAQEALDKLETDFKDSGAPEDWSQTQ